MVRFADYRWRVGRTRSDILRVLIFTCVFSLGLMFLSQLLLAMFGVFGEVPGSTLEYLLLSLGVALTGGVGLLLFRMFRTRRGILKDVYGSTVRPRIPAFVRFASDGLVRMAMRMTVPADAYMFKRGPWPARFAVAAYTLCITLSMVGLATGFGKVEWFYGSAGFFLMLPIFFFWVGVPAGKRSVSPDLVVWALVLGTLSSIPAVLVEGLASGYGLQAHLDPGTLRDFVETAVTPGVVEEFFKAISVLLLVGRFRDRRGGMVAGACVGLGFAFFENILYFAASQGSPVLLIRPTNMVLHMAGPVLLGSVVGAFRRDGFSPGRTFLAFLAGVLLHVGWNGSLSLVSYLAWNLEGVGIHRDATYLGFVAALYLFPVVLSVLLYRMMRGRRGVIRRRVSFPRL